MAISQTMSNPSDWLFQPYQNEFSHINQFQTSPTDAFSAAAATSAAVAPRSNNNLSPEQGRVAKPIRRRSRASRRTPTTLLNTDTTNFRAMVQHFTGGPAAAASFSARQQIPNRGGAINNYMEHVAAAGAAAPSGGFHMQYPNQVMQPQQPHMFMTNGMHGSGGSGPPQAAPGNGNRINYDNFMV